MSLKNFQEQIGVTADGAFGPKTLEAGMRYLKLTPEQAAHFFAQTSHETGNFRAFTENLNYSAAALRAVFGKYFDQQSAKEYERQPERIANRVYANRMGNGDEASGDGWKYRGRGALQLTGRNNYTAFADYLERADLVDNPDLVATEFAFQSALFFFDTNRLWSLCDKVDDESIRALTRRINGGFNGLEDRQNKTHQYYGWLKK